MDRRAVEVVWMAGWRAGRMAGWTDRHQSKPDFGKQYVFIKSGRLFSYLLNFW